MKLLHISEIGQRTNGIGMVLSRLAEEQRFLGNDVKVLSFNDNIAYPHMDITCTKTKKDFAAFIDSWRPDAVMFHSIWSMQFIIFSKVIKQKGIPYGVMLHGADSYENRKKHRIRKWVANILWFNRFIKDAQAIVFLCKNEYNNWASKGLNRNIVFLPNGIDLKQNIPPSKQLHLPVNILYLSRLDIYHKGVDLLLEAIEILKNRGLTNLHFTFHGNLNDVNYNEIRDKISKMGPIVSFDGPAYDKEKEKAYLNADIFILTSRFEGMPMSVLEALSYGVPCILTPGTNMSEEVEAAGAGWKTGLDSEEIADTIIKAIECLSLNSRKYHEAAIAMSKEYDWKVVARKSIVVMQEICRKK